MAPTETTDKKETTGASKLNPDAAVFKPNPKAAAFIPGKTPVQQQQPVQRTNSGMIMVSICSMLDLFFLLKKAAYT